MFYNSHAQNKIDDANRIKSTYLGSQTNETYDQYKVVDFFRQKKVNS
jgi:hypothetical protein